MSDAIASVIVASAQSVAKVFVIGAMGYGAVKFPRKAPFLPRDLVSPVARFTFHALTIPLIYSTIAVAVSPQSVGNYWFLIVGGWVVLGVSYLVATILGMCAKISNPQDFVALRVASTFPNIVALPILIFPSLCEFPVVYEGYALDYYDFDTTTTNSTGAEGDESSISSADMRRECVAQSNTMIFCYFFAWSLAFWSFGYPQLMRAAKQNNHNLHSGDEDVQATTTTRQIEDSHHTTTGSADISSPSPDKLVDIDPESGEMTIAKEESLEPETQPDAIEERIRQQTDRAADEDDINQDKSSTEKKSSHALNVPSTGDSTTVGPASQSLKMRILNTLQHFWKAFKQTTTSPGFIAMVLAFITACIPPLQNALFEPGGALRFFGSAMVALGTASSPISTMVVAASLVPPSPFQADSTSTDTGTDDDDNNNNADNDSSGPILDERPGMTDPNFGPYQRPRRRQRRDRRSSRLSNLRRSLRSSSMRMLQAIPRSTPEMRRLHVWFCVSRLIVSPAVVVGIILAFDCSASNILSSVPNLAKLVIIVNSALPGALIVVVLLKGKVDCADTAAAVSKVYLPSYLISILTIAAWCSVGMWITLPDEEGNTFCQR